MTTGNHKGQASVFVLALIGIILVCVIFLFESGRITSEKMQLQNAADAAAFGAATLEARSLNFAAYTNRAMVANEVAIGQLVGMLSLIDEFKTTGEFLGVLGEALDAAGALLVEFGVGAAIEVIGQAVGDFGDALAELAEDMEEAIKPIAEGLIKGLSVINNVYSVTQTIYHGMTMVLETTTILQSIEDNVPGTTPFNPINLFDPDKKGAHLSDLGMFALAAHMPSYWSGYTKRYTTQQISQDKKDEDEQKKKDEDEKLAPYKEKVDEDQKELNALNTKLNDLSKKYKDAVIALNGKKSDCQDLKTVCDRDPKKNKDKCDKIKECHQEQEALQQKVDTLGGEIKDTKEQIKQKQKEKDDDEAELQEEEKKLDDGGGDGGDDGGNDKGMSRMAAAIRLGRDPFSSGGPKVLDDGLNYYNRNWNLGLGFSFIRDFKLNLRFFKIDLGRFGVEFAMGLDSKGGSELRNKNNSYAWSAVDTSAFDVLFKIYMFGEGIGGDIGAPTGGGGYQATGAASSDEEGEEGEEGGAGNQLTLLDMPASLGLSTDLQPQAYGGAGSDWYRVPAWEVAGAEMTDEDNVLAGAYGGLRPYRDMNDKEKKESYINWPWTAPTFLVGVTRKVDDITKTSSNYSPDEAPHFAGGLNLYDGGTDDPCGKTTDRLGSIAKSEVYFNRPTDKDARHFWRTDLNDSSKLSRMHEDANVFSPFWQARLVKTSDFDRLLSLAVQQKTVWLNCREVSDISPELNKLIREFEKILQLNPF